MKSVNICFYIMMVIMIRVVSGHSDLFNFGACKPGKESCRDCYLELVRSLLGSDENVFNLSYVFTPPLEDVPNSVIVKYHFENETMSYTKRWFWAQSGAYFIHPLFIFQFISFLFGNPKPLYEQLVDVTLNATECYGVDNRYMTLLTQRLKVYMFENSIHPKISGDYAPMAANKETLMDALRNVSYSDLLPASTSTILIACPIVAAFLIFVIIIILLITYVSGGNLRKRAKIKLSNQAKAAILSISFVSLGRILAFISMDSIAIHNRNLHWDKEVEDIYHPGKLGDLHDIMYHIPDELLAFDILACVLYIIIVGITVCLKNNWTPRCYIKNNFKDFHYYFLSLTSLCFVLSSIMHAPYIAMAYLSDAHYAGSIFIYYVIILFLEFGLLQYIFNTCFNKILCSFAKVMCLAIVSWLLLYGLIITVSFFFYFVPIKNLLSNAPNEAVLVYQSALVLAGAYITYKAIFEKIQDPEKVLTIDRQIKKNEIALVENEIAILQMSLNGDRINFLRSKIDHLRNELQLSFLYSKTIHLARESDSQLENQIEINRLYCQQYEIVNYLKEEVTRLNEAITTNHEGTIEEEINIERQAEIYRLRNVILAHLHRNMDQLRGEPDKRDEIADAWESISNQKEAICFHLQSEIDRLERKVINSEWKIKRFQYERSHLQDAMSQ